MDYKIIDHHNYREISTLSIETFSHRRGDLMFRSEMIIHDSLYNKLDKMSNLVYWFKPKYSHYSIFKNNWEKVELDFYRYDTLIPHSKYPSYKLQTSYLTIECSKKSLSKLLLIM